MADLENCSEDKHSTPAQKAMKQTSKTSAERGEAPTPEEANDSASDQPVRPGDAGVGQSGNQGSSPYQDRSRPEESKRKE